MGKKKGKGLSPPSEEYSRFKTLLRQLVAVPKKEVEEKMAERKEQKRHR